VIAERDLRLEQRVECRRGGKRAAIEAREDVIERLERARHLEIRELAAQVVASGRGGFHPATSTSC
jgi:hypothetical protein